MLLAHMVVRNEAQRLLVSCLEWNSQWWDVLHVYDDQSDDETAATVYRYTDKITIRPDDVPSFHDDEGAFRQAAWDDMETRINWLHEGDWVVCIDADEFFVGAEHYMKPHEAIEQYIDYAVDTGRPSVELSIPEIWYADGMPHLQRIDGWWGKNRGVRICQWRPKGKFRDAMVGCGSVPTYAEKNPVTTISVGSILHYGYALDGAPQRKHEIYSAPEGNMHDRDHVASIINKPQLAEWKGVTPCISESSSLLSARENGIT
jgi:Glycosyl transferase family 2